MKLSYAVRTRSPNRPNSPVALRLERLETRDVPSYTIVDLGTLGGATTAPTDINDKGQVVGYSQTATTTHAFLWDPVGGMQDLETSSTALSHAYGINNLGQVVGWSSSGGFVWEPGLGTQALPPLPDHASSHASAINDLGQIVGWSKVTSFSGSRATLWDRGTPVDLGTIGTQHSKARDINDRSQVVVEIGNPPAGNSSAVWQNGSMTDIGTLGDWGTGAREINERGQVTGGSPVDGPGNFLFIYHAFLFTQNGSLQDLRPPSCSGDLVSFASAEGINDSGQIVGRVGCVMDPPVQVFNFAAIREPSGSWQALNELIPPGSEWNLTSAAAINNRGQIVGVGFNSLLNTYRAFLLTPAPAPPAAQSATTTDPQHNLAVLITAKFQTDD